MKKRLFSFIFSIIAIAVSAQNVGIIPQPQRVVVNEEHLKIEKKTKSKVQYQIIESIGVNGDNQDQAYTLEVNKNGIIVNATTEKGLFYGKQSVEQLFSHYENRGQIPCMNVVDWPDMKYRGWMDDISRGPIPTLQFLKKEIATLARYKMNVMQLYSENHPNGGLTVDELHELTEFAKQYHVEIIGNQQCFAHADKILATGDTFDPNDENTYRILETLLDKWAPAYESPLFNINCDEVEGVSDTVYCDHINKVYNILQKYDKKVMMWGDVVAKNPKMVKMLPDDMIFIAWSYVGFDDYEMLLKPFMESKHEFWVAPGASCWNTCCPDVRNYIKNIANLSRDAYRFGATGVMNTAWDDCGESLFSSVWHSMAWCAETSWNTINGKNPDKRERDFNKNYKTKVRDLYMLSDLRNDPYMDKLMNFNALNEPLLDFFPSQVDTTALNNSISAQANAILAYNKFSNATEKVAAYRIYTAALKNELKVSLYNTLNDPTEDNVLMSRQLMEKLNEALDKLETDYMKLWDSECRPYYKDVIQAKYDKIREDLNSISNKVYIRITQAENDQPLVSMQTIFNDKQIYYSINGNDSTLYEKPFTIDKTCTLTAGGTQRNVLYHKGIGHLKSLNSQPGAYRAEYSGGGADALLDGILGNKDDYKDGTWQGFYATDADIELDFGKKESINRMKINFLANPFDWILLPKTVNLFTSSDGINYEPYLTYVLNEEVPSTGNTVVGRTFYFFDLRTRYLRITVDNPGLIPEGLPGYDNMSWMFMDEIVIE